MLRNPWGNSGGGVGMSTFLAVAHTVDTPHVQCKFENTQSFSQKLKNPISDDFD